MTHCQAVRGSRLAAMRAAVSVELIHAYSLVHDDMPCMDNDVLRRGKPTVHVRYGQAQAMLAGDAMQALAELETLVAAMEAGKMPLDQLLASYKRGAELLQHCRSRLQAVEDQVKLLEDGQLKAWADA